MAVIDHLVYAVPALDSAINQFESATGVRPVLGGSHPGLGTHNALVSFGDNYLELIAADPGQPDPAGPRPFGIDQLDGPSLVTFAVRPHAEETIEELVESIRLAGFEPGEIAPMSRRQTNGDELHWRLTFPQLELGGCVPFIIDWGSTNTPATTAPGGVELVDLQLRHDDPLAVRRALLALGLSMNVVDSDAVSLHASIRGHDGSIEI
jgi:hypothetical protein